MLEYRTADVSRLLKNVVTGGSVIGSSRWRRRAPPSSRVFRAELKPPDAADGLTPGLPAYIIFMCVRYADCVNDEQRVSSLLNSAISSIKGVVKVTPEQFPAGPRGAGKRSEFALFFSFRREVRSLEFCPSGWLTPAD